MPVVLIRIIRITTPDSLPAVKISSRRGAGILPASPLPSGLSFSPLKSRPDAGSPPECGPTSASQNFGYGHRRAMSICGPFLTRSVGPHTRPPEDPVVGDLSDDNVHWKALRRCRPALENGNVRSSLRLRSQDRSHIAVFGLPWHHRVVRPVLAAQAIEERWRSFARSGLRAVMGSDGSGKEWAADDIARPMAVAKVLRRRTWGRHSGGEPASWPLFSGEKESPARKRARRQDAAPRLLEIFTAGKEIKVL